MAIVVGLILVLASWGAVVTVVGVVVALLGLLTGLVVVLLHRLPHS